MEAVSERVDSDRRGADSPTGSDTATTGELRHEIDSTRTDLTHKLEALESRAMDTVQSAQETVEDSIQVAKDTVASVRRTFDIKYQVGRHPWAMVGGSCIAGLALGTLFARVGRRPTRVERIASDYRGNGQLSAAAPPMSSESSASSRPGLLDKFHEEIDKVKGIAIGFVMGRVRDLLKNNVPELASHVDGVMDSVTTKLGGTVTKR